MSFGILFIPSGEFLYVFNTKADNDTHDPHALFSAYEIQLLQYKPVFRVARFRTKRQAELRLTQDFWDSIDCSNMSYIFYEDATYYFAGNDRHYFEVAELQPFRRKK